MSEPTAKTISILNTSSPFGQANAKDSLDIALIMGTYEQVTHLFFQGDGVWQLVNNQQPESIQVKDFLKTFSAFEFYDLENIYVCKESLTQRKLPLCFHIDNVQVLDKKDFATKLTASDILLRF
ncbi:sulfurtransferase complex subunit TusC [Thalassotalea sp. SU-HH00458]|uniref:sulfurtransferase complex subunit TusC n=1 Tax=Thalassotalea sp. SU-HH00458 TaxID=3127657 RepID=UPI0031059E98